MGLVLDIRRRSSQIEFIDGWRDSYQQKRLNSKIAEKKKSYSRDAEGRMQNKQLQTVYLLGVGLDCCYSLLDNEEIRGWMRGD